MAGPIITLATYQLDRSKLDADFAKIQHDMKSTDANAKTTGDNISTSIKKGTAAIGDMGTEMGRLERTAQRVVERIAAFFAIESVLNFAKSSVEAFNEIEQGETKLLNALKGRVDIQQRLIAQASDIQNRTIIPKDAIIAQQAFLAAQGRTEAQIRKTVEAAVQLSAVTGHDLASEIQRLDGSQEGVLRGLNRLDSGFKKLSIEQLQNGAAIDLVLGKYKGFVEAAAGIGTGPLEQLKNKFKENVTEPIGEFITNIVDAGLAIADFVSNGFRLPKVFETTDEAAKRLNISLQEFIRLQEMGQKAAEIFGGDFGKLTDEELKKYIDKLNNEIIPGQQQFADKLGKSTTPQLEHYIKTLGDARKELEARTQADTDQSKTLESLNLALQNQQKRLQELVIGSESYVETQKKIKDIEAEIAHAKGEHSETEKKIIDAQQALVKIQLETQERLFKGLQDGEVKKIALINQTADAQKATLEKESKAAIFNATTDSNLISQIKKATANDLLAIEVERIGEIDAVLKEESEKRKKRNAENLKSDLEETKSNITFTFSLLDLQAAKDYSVKLSRAKNAKELALIEKQFSNEILQNKLRALELQLQAEKEIAPKTAQEEKETAAAIAATEKELADTKIELTKKVLEEKLAANEIIKEKEREVIQGAAQVADSVFNIGAAQRQNEMTDLQKHYSDEQQALDDQLKSKHVSQKNYDKKKADLDKQALTAENDLKRKSDKAAQDEQIYKILINAASAIALDFFDANYFKAGVDAAVSAAQIAIIEATPLPKYAKGTLSVKGGREGEDSVAALLMPGEAVIPADQARKHNRALSAMMNGGFDEFVLKSYLPRLLEAEQRSSGTMSEKMLQGLQFNDRRLIRAIKDSKPDGTVELGDRTISRLASQLNGGNQRTSNLYKRYGK